MIKDSIKKKGNIFHLESSQNSSLLNLKRQQNLLRENYISHIHEKKTGLKQMKFLTKIWKLLPLKIANFIGPKIADKLY